MMKTSQTVVLAALGVVALGMVLAAGLAHVALSQSNAEAGEDATRSYPLNDFNGIETAGRWDVTVTRGETWNVQVTYPENLFDDLRVVVENDHLVLGTRRGPGRSRGPITARIQMPNLSAVKGVGSAHIEFSGFTGDALDISIAGSGRIGGQDGSYQALKVNVSGSGQVDLRAVPVVDADVNLSGSADVRLAMNGGALDGSISGSGRIDYTGTTRQQSVRTAGSGRVTQSN